MFDVAVSMSGLLRLDLVVSVRCNVLTISGEADLASAKRLDKVMRRLEATPRRVVLDLRPLMFIDSHGLAPIVESADRRADASLPRMLLSGPEGPFLRLLDLHAARHMFEFAQPGITPNAYQVAAARRPTDPTLGSRAAGD